MRKDHTMWDYMFKIMCLIFAPSTWSLKNQHRSNPSTQSNVWLSCQINSFDDPKPQKCPPIGMISFVSNNKAKDIDKMLSGSNHLPACWLLLLLTNVVNEADDLPLLRVTKCYHNKLWEILQTGDYLLRGNYEGRDKISIQVPM